MKEVLFEVGVMVAMGLMVWALAYAGTQIIWLEGKDVEEDDVDFDRDPRGPV